MAQWYYRKGEQTQGPVDSTTFKRLALDGEFEPSDWVWREGLAEWITASRVKGLYPQPASGSESQGDGDLIAVAPAAATAAAVLPVPALQPAAAQLWPGQRRYDNYEPVYAGFWLRFCAIFIDGLIMGVVQIIFGVIASLVAAGGGAVGRTTPNPLVLLIPLLSWAVNWLYFTGMESSSMQATLGKRALGLIVTDMDGRRMSFGRANGRYFAKIISVIILYIGFIMAAFTERKQALHDMIASTLVVKGEPLN